VWRSIVVLAFPDILRGDFLRQAHSPPHILDSSHGFRMEMESPNRENLSQPSHWNLFHFAHRRILPADAGPICTTMRDVGIRGPRRVDGVEELRLRGRCTDSDFNDRPTRSVVSDISPGGTPHDWVLLYRRPRSDFVYTKHHPTSPAPRSVRQCELGETPWWRRVGRG
jgi:hypothetical protein